MGKLGFGKKLSVVHAVLTATAAVTILILSVTPSFSLGSGTFSNPKLFLYIIACCVLCFLLCSWLRVAGTTQFYKKGSRRKLFVLHAVLTAAAAVTILVLSVIPPLFLSDGTSANSGLFPHMIAYGTLCFLICMWLRVAGTTQSPVFSAFFLTSIYGLLIECIQFGIPYRSFEISDVLVNCMAAATAIIPCFAVTRYVPLYKKIDVQEVSARLN